MAAVGVSTGVHTLKVQKPGTNTVAMFDLNTAWASVTCPHCTGNQALRVARSEDDIAWFRCVTCLGGFVSNQGTISPSTRPLRTPDKLPPGDLAVWEEVRTCLGSGAYMAAVMLCRKLLLHLAVENGLESENAKGHAPGFAECVKHLQKAGVITQQMLEWVEPIKDVGNTANHKIATVSQDQAEQVATFTLQLLVLAYELRMTPAAPPAPQDPGTTIAL